MRRGEIWWAKLPEPAGKRPVLLLSRNEAYAVRNSVTAAEVTSRIRGIPVEVQLGLADGMPKECVVNLDTIITITKSLIETRITALDNEKMKEVEKAIKFALAIT
ncbi:hypothetical protein COY52_05095 [Candidatus Desantisbacteria bacterium CG_4_10_14_0_8_um_filter_48_22]|uniref:PemK family transcriptional regulator n=1 Tax=Candidatus Desantisbacteria bacterium CG_4_10_14_0_8_um_filter_48_22 TaxID=1974543 RepID=A0A2M7SC76_9BACT|nr:MAG: hypothetical protein AUJ67_02165 [Candidatus Desantisbacteria bacterium CG1_02_49_89]PIV55174.1 MAG: hypothetical protein COS16_08185 [Candidatus Desantisbacteria bacterium CG02_land_8_20_14_3_00_49_13]PIZ17132.1 MAG: hypothetical protein COY52_05095 [Candidatus Desantisbacteria bacterium CG_4_10_14_0_8_um_filter_48_22]PJB28237.1 MAG: hypothetical protein CO111_02125 [Candidatus Desantisbacteria bacterium CG_4_9_14_3_um_filter_50_7]